MAPPYAAHCRKRRAPEIISFIPVSPTKSFLRRENPKEVQVVVSRYSYLSHAIETQAL